MMQARSGPLISMNLERAIRLAAQWHDGGHRKGSKLPYIVHPFGVAMILDRLGFDETVVVAGLLHDVVEDTDATLADLEREFGARVAEIVGWCSERKTDDAGLHRPWSDRKRDHLAALSAAPFEARAVVLADKLHNLTSIRFDLDEGRPVWTLFNASRRDVLDQYQVSIEQLGRSDSRLAALLSACREALAAVASVPAV
jgi:guanosine-3',5'-bis(diphosphate) 3'-pyrophosphohydrolase